MAVRIAKQVIVIRAARERDLHAAEGGCGRRAGRSIIQRMSGKLGGQRKICKAAGAEAIAVGEIVALQRELAVVVEIVLAHSTVAVDCRSHNAISIAICIAVENRSERTEVVCRRRQCIICGRRIGIGRGIIPDRTAGIVQGAGDVIPLVAVHGNLNAARFGVVVEGVAVDDEVHAVLVGGVVKDTGSHIPIRILCNIFVCSTKPCFSSTIESIYQKIHGSYYVCRSGKGGRIR